MTTTVVALTNAEWTEVASGPVFMSLAEDSENAPGPLRGAGFEDGILVHVGTVAPALSTFACHSVAKEWNYPYTQKTFARSKAASRLVIVTPLV